MTRNVPAGGHGRAHHNHTPDNHKHAPQPHLGNASVAVKRDPDIYSHGAGCFVIVVARRHQCGSFGRNAQGEAKQRASFRQRRSGSRNEDRQRKASCNLRTQLAHLIKLMHTGHAVQ